MKKLAHCILLCVSLLLLSGCVQQTEKTDGPLTQAQIARANEAFAYSDAAVEYGHTTVYPSEISCFFTSDYSEPSEIDLWEFLLYCPIGTVLEDRDVEEFQAVLAAVEIDGEKFPLPSDYVVPVHRYRKADVSAMLKKYADITVEDLTGTEGTVYLEEYDSFYNFTSDFGPGYFECVSGEKSGDTIRLWSDTDAANGLRRVLTLREQEGRYFIWSFMEEVSTPE